MNNLDEIEIINSVENEEWKTVQNLSEFKKKLRKAATATAIKDYRMNVRISKRDVDALKTRALEEGIPYHTLVTSILHKYVTGKLTERSRHHYA